MLGRLESQRLLTVVGSSGCGKSSLVRAGLLPALEEGFLFGGASNWRFAILRPGDHPNRKLALALCEALPELPSTVVGETTDFVEAALLSGEHSLLKLISNLHLNSGTCLLVLVDQFEELFRWRVGTYSQPRDSVELNHSSYETRTEATNFVDLLLRTVERQNGGIAPASPPGSDASSKINWQCPIFIVLTMRSEFIGHCDMFLGLPEAITASQFLTPRMTREQMKDAIERPLRLFSSVAHPGLVNRILNDVGPDPDSLPLMQHCLLRTWQTAGQRRSNEASKPAERIELTIADYVTAGTFTNALEKHADEAFFELGGDPKNGRRLQRVAELLFRL